MMHVYISSIYNLISDLVYWIQDLTDKPVVSDSVSS